MVAAARLHHGAIGGDGIPALRLRPTRPSNLHIIYLHGGAFVYPLLPMHWLIIAALMNRTQATVTVPSYALAPESTFDDSIGAIDAIVQAVLADSPDATVILAGDSSGGNLAIVQALRSRDRGGRQPAGLLLFSPWVDLATSNPEVEKLAATDPILAQAGAQAAGRWWAGERPLTDPMISPVHSDLSDLPPITVLQGGYDILQPDAQKFVAAARDAGNDIKYHMVPEGFHVYVAAVATPEAQGGFGGGATPHPCGPRHPAAVGLRPRFAAAARLVRDQPTAAPVEPATTVQQLPDFLPGNTSWDMKGAVWRVNTSRSSVRVYQ